MSATKPVTYTPAQLAIWKKTHKDFRSGSIRAGNAMIMRMGPTGSMMVSLRSL